MSDHPINYSESTDGIRPDMLAGFFVGWPAHPSPATHLRILRQSAHVVLALPADRARVIGFITAVSDGVLSACIPLLEVLPEYQRRGIGRELVRRMLERLRGKYMVDLVCDADVVPFYEKLGLRRMTAMSVRNRDALE